VTAATLNPLSRPTTVRGRRSSRPRGLSRSRSGRVSHRHLASQRPDRESY
jgi:hypothetical protein